MADKQLIKALLVEDNPEIAERIRDMLRKSQTISFEVTHEASLKPALDFINTHTADVIGLDLVLPDPGRNGHSCCPGRRAAPRGHQAMAESAMIRPGYPDMCLLTKFFLSGT